MGILSTATEPFFFFLEKSAYCHIWEVEYHGVTAAELLSHYPKSALCQFSFHSTAKSFEIDCCIGLHILTVLTVLYMGQARAFSSHGANAQFATLAQHLNTLAKASCCGLPAPTLALSTWATYPGSPLTLPWVIQYIFSSHSKSIHTKKTSRVTLSFFKVDSVNQMRTPQTSSIL